MKTIIALLLAGTSYHGFGVWYKKVWFSLFGYLVGYAAFIHGLYLITGDFSSNIFPVALLLGLLYWEAIGWTGVRFLSLKKARQLLRSLVWLRKTVWILSALGLWTFLYSWSKGDYWAWIPLLLYLSGYAFWNSWIKKKQLLLLIAFSIFAQVCFLLESRGDSYWNHHDELFLTLGSILLVFSSAFYAFERLWNQSVNHYFSILLKLFFTAILVSTIFLLNAATQDFQYFTTILIWAIVTFNTARFLNIPLLYFWPIVLLYLLFSSSLEVFFGVEQAPMIQEEYWELFLRPLSLAILSLCITGLSFISEKQKRWFQSRYAVYKGNFPVLTPKLFAYTVLTIAVAAYFLAFYFPLHSIFPEYHYQWSLLLGLGIAALSALLVARVLSYSRHLVFFLFYLGFCLFLFLTLQTTFRVDFLYLGERFYLSENLFDSELLLLIGISSFFALFTTIVVDRKSSCINPLYLLLKDFMAGLVFFLLIGSYFLSNQQNLIVWQRFIVSAFLLFGVSLYFRYWRSSECTKGEYRIYAIGLSASIVIILFTLLYSLLPVQLFKSTVPWIFSAPAFWFYLRYEWHCYNENNPEQTERVIHLQLWFLLLLYLVPNISHWLLFVDYSRNFAHYFQYAPLLFLMGIVWIRLRVFPLGVPVVITGLFFALSLVLSLFIGELSFTQLTMFSILFNGVLWILLQKEKTAGKLLDRWAKFTKEEWTLFEQWMQGYGLLGSHLFLITTMFEVERRVGSSWSEIGWLLIPIACLWIYLGFTRKNIFVFHIALFELLTSFFLIDLSISFISGDQSIWGGIFLYLVLLFFSGRYFQKQFRNSEKHLLVWWGAITIFLFAHLIYFPGYSLIFAALILGNWWWITFLTPYQSDNLFRFFNVLFYRFLIYTPAVLLFMVLDVESETIIVPELTFAFLLLCLSQLGLTFFKDKLTGWAAVSCDKQERAIHSFIDFLSPKRFREIPYIATAFVGILLYFLYEAHETVMNSLFIPLLLLQGTLLYYWYSQAKSSKRPFFTLLSGGMFAGMLFVFRERIVMAWQFMEPEEFDLFSGVFLVFAGSVLKPILEKESSSIQKPVRYSLFALPLLTVLYAFRYDVSVDLLVRVIFLYSLLFLWKSYHEKDRLALSFAFLGWNAYFIFTILDFNIQSPLAYVTPASISLLALVQVFRKETPLPVVKWVRVAALMILFGTAGFQILTAQQLDLYAHLSVLVLSCLAIVAANFMRIKIFAGVGLFCFVVEIMALIWIALSVQEASILKVVVGFVLTVGGGIILFSYFLYRKYKPQITATLEKLKTNYQSWE